MHHPPLGLPVRDRHRQRTLHQFGPHVRRHRPADDAAAPGIEHDREVQPAIPSAHLGDVGDPQLVGPVGREVAVHQVRRGPGLRVLLRRRRLEAPPRHAMNAQIPHQACHALPAHPLARRLQFRLDPRAAIGLPAAAPDQQDLALELDVAPRPRRGRTLQPAVVPAGGETQHPAHGRKRKHGPVRLHERVPPLGIESLSLANQAAAFFRMSRSIRSRLTSRFRRSSSRRASVVSPSLRRPSSRSGRSPGSLARERQWDDWDWKS